MLSKGISLKMNNTHNERMPKEHFHEEQFRADGKTTLNKRNLIDDSTVIITSINGFFHTSYIKGVSDEKEITRPYHGIQVRIGGNTTFNTDNKVITTQPGDIVYVPQGLHYYKANRTNGECYQINFTTLSEYDDQIRIIHPKSSERFIELFEKGIMCDIHHAPSSISLKYSILYEILYQFKKALEANYCPSSKMKQIEPAVKYICAEPAADGMAVDELAAMCGISETYFRQIFRQVYGVTPIRYIQLRRLAKAKKLIQSGIPIKEAAEQSGFCDASYFTKIFHRENGILPSEYLRSLEY